MDINEDLLLVTANQIVNGFMQEGEALTEGVKKKASEMGLNNDQTSRLIERTNSEAFLRVFPERTDFAVADPNEILGQKIASVDSNGKEVRSYKQATSKDFDEIFGNVHTKTASDYGPSDDDMARAILKDRVFESAISEQIRLAKYASEQLIDNAEANAWGVFKDTVLFGTPVSDIERDLVLAYPEKRAFVEDVITEFAERLNKPGVNPELLKRASEIDEDEVVLETHITMAFKGLIDLV